MNQAVNKYWQPKSSSLLTVTVRVPHINYITSGKRSNTFAGFFYVTGHGLSNEAVRRQYAIAQEFFDLPLEEKNKYLANTAAGDFRGYKPQATSNDNDERYNIPKFTPEHERPHPSLIWNHYEEIKKFSLVRRYTQVS